MPIAIKCSRCGKAYSVADEMAGSPVQCRHCRFIMVVPEPAGQSSAHARETFVHSAAAPDLEAAVAMEQSASAAEETKVIVSRRQWFAPRHYSTAEPQAGPVRQKRNDALLIVMALVPLLVGGIFLYYLVPWQSTRKVVTATPPAGNAFVSPSVNVEPADTNSHPAPITPPTVPDWQKPVPASAPRWMPESPRTASFGDYLAVDAFAIRGPTSELHLDPGPDGSLCWLGPARPDTRARLTLRVSAAEDPLQRRRKFDAETEGVEIGRMGPDELGATVTGVVKQDEAHNSYNFTQYDVYDRGKHAHIEIIASKSDFTGAFDLLNACAKTLRRSQPNDQVWSPLAAASSQLRSYNRSLAPEDWSVDPDPAELQPAQSGYGFTICPPLKLRLVGPGIWAGESFQFVRWGVASGLPMVHVVVKRLDQSQSQTPEAWANEQWNKNGIEVKWGLIDGIKFAQISYKDTTSGRDLTIHSYVGRADDKWIQIDTVTVWADPRLEPAVGTFKLHRPAATRR